MQFFNDQMTLDEIKAEYRRQARLHHPDVGGDTVTMQALNAEYANVMSQRIRKERPGKTPQEYANLDRYAENIREMIEKVIMLDGIKIEIIGWWVWITGDTYPNRQAIYDAGYEWSGSKKAWKYAGCPSLSRRHMSLDEIRNYHGTTVVKDGDEDKPRAVAAGR
jgi:hypothetical protein